MLKSGAQLNITDSDGRDAMAYAVMGNSKNVVDFLIKNSTSGKSHLKFDNQDLEGKTAVHLVVNPCLFGSYENLNLIHSFKNSKYSEQFNTKDNSGKTPLDYARLQQSGKLYKALSG